MTLDKIKKIALMDEWIGDLDTPVSAYLKLSHSFDKNGSFLLESVTGGEQVARYSFIGFLPFLEFCARQEFTSIRTDASIFNEPTTDPFCQLQTVLDALEITGLQDNLPDMIGSVVGYFAWESMQFIESLSFRHPSCAPLAHFVLPSLLVVFDHAKRKLLIITFVNPGYESDGHLLLKAVKTVLCTPASLALLPLPNTPQQTVFDHVISNMDKSTFMSRVDQTKSHIFEGDIFQLLLSQKFFVPQQKSALDVYRNLRLINPSPYMFFMDFGRYQLVGSSPEILVKNQNGLATVRPIAGTRARIIGEESRLIQELMSDQKERAEHMMLVDLGRNDLGRVCEVGSIHVNRLMEIEQYSHVLHMVSHITGQLRSDQSSLDLLKATFPAGTLSGTPKIKAIDLIEQLEPDARGVYGGALGYIHPKGNMDLCIAIRTVYIEDQLCCVQAGAGIVADSIASAEYEETQNKAKGMLQACIGSVS